MAKPVEVLESEFKGNVKITASGKEIRVWVCNDQGENIFRFKALGEVHYDGKDFIVIPPRSK